MAAPYPVQVWHETVGETLRVLLFPVTATETVNNDGTETFVNYTIADIDDYGFHLAPSEVGSKLHVGNVPDWVPVGNYLARVMIETAGVITQASEVVEEGVMSYGDGAFAPADTTSISFSYNVAGDPVDEEFEIYWAGAGTPIDFQSVPAAAADSTLFEARIGSEESFIILPVLAVNGGVAAAGIALTGLLRATPTPAQSAKFPRKDCIIELWRTGSGPTNTTPVAHHELDVRRTLR